MRIITGSTGTTHVTSNDDGEFNQGIFGNGLIVFDNGNKLSASIIDNNTIRVEDGDLVFQGRHALIAPNTTEDITIETGMVGANRNDLIVARYVLDSATGYETITLEVLKGTETSGTAVDPEYETGDIRTGDLLVEVPLYRVKIEGINIVKLEALFEATKDIISLIADLQNENSKLNSEISKEVLYSATKCEVIKKNNTIHMYVYGLPCNDVIYLLKTVLQIHPSHMVFSDGMVKHNTRTGWVNSAFYYKEGVMAIGMFVLGSGQTEMSLTNISEESAWLYHGTIIFDI